jgi:hypothetical protein
MTETFNEPATAEGVGYEEPADSTPEEGSYDEGYLAGFNDGSGFESEELSEAEFDKEPPTPEETAEGKARLGAAFEQMQSVVGDFDQNEALQEAEALFPGLLAAGVDPDTAMAQALAEGARAAADMHRGRPLDDVCATKRADLIDRAELRPGVASWIGALCPSCVQRFRKPS